MLALVKKPRIEISLQGERVDELIEWIGKKFEVSILTSDNADSVAIEDTDFWKEMQSNRIGNLLSAARLKAGLSQSQLAEKLGIRQNMVIARLICYAAAIFWTSLNTDFRSAL